MEKIHKEQVKRKRSKKLIHFAIFIVVLITSTIWVLSTIETDTGSVVEEKIRLIMLQEKEVIDRYHTKDLEVFENVKASLIEDLNNLFENIKQKKKAKDDLRIIISANNNLPEQYLRELSYTKARAGVASNLNTPKSVLERLSMDIEEEIRANIAKNPSTPNQTLQNLVDDPEEIVRVMLALNPRTPKNILLKLAQENNSEINLSLAKNPSTPFTILTKFRNGDGAAIFGKCELLTSVFSNPALKSKALGMEKNNESDCIRIGIAKNPNTNSEILDLLAKDNEKSVRKAVAENPNTSPTTLSFMVKNEPDGWLTTPRDYAFSNPNIPVELIEANSQTDDKTIIINIAKNYSTPVSILKMLEESQDSSIQAAVCSNSLCPVDILSKLAAEEKFKEKIANNINCPAYILMELLNSPDEEAGIEGFVEEISGLAGINPTLIIKWGKGLLKDGENKELIEYVNMVFADNLFSSSELVSKLNQLYSNNIRYLQNQLVANMNEMLVEISLDLSSNPQFSNISIVADKQIISDTFSQSLTNVSSGVVKSTVVLTATTVSMVVYELISDVIIPILRKVATRTATAASVNAASQSGGSDWKVAALKIAVQVAVQFGIEMYAEYQIKEKLNFELNNMKESILNGNDGNEGFLTNIKSIFQGYRNDKYDKINLALKSCIKIKS